MPSREIGLAPDFAALDKTSLQGIERWRGVEDEDHLDEQARPAPRPTAAAASRSPIPKDLTAFASGTEARAKIEAPAKAVGPGDDGSAGCRV